MDFIMLCNLFFPHNFTHFTHLHHNHHHWFNSKVQFRYVCLSHCPQSNAWAYVRGSIRFCITQ
jgi:hypothetical protein